MTACDGRRRRRRCAASGLAIVALLVTAFSRPVPRLIWNATASAPLGLYRLDDTRTVRRGDLVLADPPPAIRGLAAARGYLPRDVALVKRIAASTGDTVCSDGVAVAIDGRIVARALRADPHGRILPHWTGCRTLGKDDLFLLMTDVSTSFDGRYFGPVGRNAVIGRLAPLWTW